MTTVLTVCDVAANLFDQYGPAVTDLGHGRYEMTLAEPGMQFWTLSYDQPGREYGLRGHGRPYGERTIIHRRAGNPLAADVLAASAPLPAHGSLFAWGPADAEYAEGVIAVWTAPVPTWAVMPRADLDEDTWPPYVSEALPGPWFWPHVAADLIVPLNAEINPGTFWWTTRTGDDAPVLAVAHEVVTPPGLVIAAESVFAHHEALRSGEWIPGLDDALTDPNVTDLALAGS